MQLQTNKTKTTAALFLLILAISIALTELPNPTAQAQLAATQPTSGPLPAGVTVNFTVATVAYMSIRPATVGLGQPFIVNLFPIPAPNANRKFKDLKVTITKPDSTTEVITLDSYVADGTAWFEYIADQEGQWRFKFELPGQYYPAGRYLDGNIITATSGGTLYTESVYYQPSSTKEMTITVQKDMVYSYPDLGLPTDYWTRPIPYEHREWWIIGGDFPWRGPSGGPMWEKLYPDTNPYWGGYYMTGMGGPWRGHFTPWVQGPNSAHVAWKRQYTIAGIIGGDYRVEIADVNIFGNSGVGRYPTIVYAGRAYMALSKPGSGKTAATYWQCFDYRTGEMIWERPLESGESAPSVIEYFNQGLLPGGQVSITPEHVTSVYLLSISGGYLRKYDPWTGAMVANISISPMTGTGGIYYMNGHVLGVQDLGAAAGANRYRLINWTTFGTSTNFATRVMNNISWPWSSLPETTDYGAGVSVMTSKSFVGGAPNKTDVMAASLKTGQQLWRVTLDEWEYSTNTQYVDHGKFAMLTEQGYFIALDVYTGKVVWKSDRFDYPWDEPGFGGYNVLSAYGLLYRNAYTGIYAFNWTNGKLAWKYTCPADAAYETPYVNVDGITVYSTNIGGAIADGKYYIYNTEHSATVPITRGWQLHCINATTGELIWKVGLPGASSKHTTDLGPIADGYLSVGGSDGYMYVFGKGKSKTTVTAGPKTIALGEKILIEGTVLDMSPAQPGTPCVSKDSMKTQMEYLHKQMPIDGIWHNETITGVPVLLTAIDPNGNTQTIGEVTTNGYYGTFSCPWTPEIEGTYTIIATFAGDDSYGSSAAATSIYVGPAPAPTPTAPPPEAPIDYTWTIIGMGIAIIIAVAVATLLIIRKRA
ncbi:MAG: PQQ-binding-like beta-propeller repeat protein [Candidatus Bathyarchaeia archaeon]